MDTWPFPGNPLANSPLAPQPAAPATPAQSMAGPTQLQTQSLDSPDLLSPRASAFAGSTRQASADSLFRQQQERRCILQTHLSTWSAAMGPHVPHRPCAFRAVPLQPLSRMLHWRVTIRNLAACLLLAMCDTAESTASLFGAQDAAAAASAVAAATMGGGEHIMARLQAQPAAGHAAGAAAPAAIASLRTAIRWSRNSQCTSARSSVQGASLG